LSVRTDDPGAQLRAAAARLELQVVRDRLPLEAAFSRVTGVASRDMGTLRALVSGSLRWHFRLQWQIEQLLHKPPGRRDALLGSLLRTGLYQLQWMRIPDHAAVSATVDAARRLGLQHAGNVVNAVMRRFLRERARLDTAMADVPQALHAHPDWMLSLLQADWPQHWGGIVAANNESAPMWLRINRTRIDRAAYLSRLAKAGMVGHAHPELIAAVRLEQPVAVADLPGYDEGLVSVQDGAAQLAAGRLKLAPGMRVLDACAAPGGKTAHILETCPDVDEVVAVDRDVRRLDTLRDNLARLGLAATVTEADAARPSEWWDGREFDRILLDAPCSALGVIRRHPDIKVLRRPEDLAAVVQLQQRLLRALWPLLAPGGRLVYATCTVVKEENDGQIARFVSACEGAGPAHDQAPLQLLPGEANMDGFYYACLSRQESSQSSRVS
jgi:16S rRNA (cytosine967-C5)-methyltransferase